MAYSGGAITIEPKAIYQFGPFRLDQEARILLSGGKTVFLTPKVFELLLALVEKRGQLIAKDDLIKAVWPDSFVEEGNLTSNISILRKQLGLNPDGGEYIETIPKRGYRFVATVTQVEDQHSGRSSSRGSASETVPVAEEEARPENRRPDGRHVFAAETVKAGRDGKRAARLAVVLAVAGTLTISLLVLYLGGWHSALPGFGAPARIKALAVLPLENLSGDEAQEYFADGMTEALTADLAQIGALRVISRTSVMQFKRAKKPLPEIARQLKVDAVVIGTVLRSGQRVRITAELIHASTDEHLLWARTYERNLGDILDLQNDVARAIATEVQAKLTPQEQVRLARTRAVNPDAYEAYLKGRYYWNEYTEEALLKSIEYFEQAIKLDPAYAAAYAGLADAWMGLDYIGAPPEQVRPKAMEAARKALSMDDSLAEAHAAMAMIRAHEWDWGAAERENKKAFELNPGYALAHLYYSNELRHLGRREESIDEAKRALELDPLSPITNGQLANVYLSARQYDLAIKQYEKTLELYPNQSTSHNLLGWAYFYKGMYDKGIGEIQKSLALDGDDATLSPDLAYIYAVLGKKGEARKILERLLKISKQAPVQAHHFVLIYIGLGEMQEAFSFLEKAYQQRSPMMFWLKVDPRFDSLRPDPRFQDLMRRVGLV